MNMKKILAGAVAAVMTLGTAYIAPLADETADGEWTEIDLNSYDTDVSDSALVPSFDDNGVMYLSGDNRNLLYDIGNYIMDTEGYENEIKAVRIEYMHDGYRRTHNFFSGYMCDFSAAEKTSANIRNGRSSYSRKLFGKNGDETYTHESNPSGKDEFKTLTIDASEFADLTNAPHGTDFWLHVSVCDHTYIKSIAVQAKKQEIVKTPTTVTVSGEKRVNSYGKAGSYTYTASVLDQFGAAMPDETVTWSVESDAENTGVKISAGGVMSVPADEPAQTVTVTASCGDIQSEGFPVEIICEDESHPSEIKPLNSIRMRGEGNGLYENPAAGNEIGMYQANAVMVFRFDLANALSSGDEISNITLNLENSDSNWSRDAGIWLYEQPGDDTRQDGREWKDTDWTDASAKSDVQNNISLVLGSSDYAVSGGNTVAFGRGAYTDPIAAAKAAGGKYEIELTGDTLSRAIKYAEDNDNKLDIVLTSSIASPESENRLRIYPSDSDGHRGPYLSVKYRQPASIIIDGVDAIDLDTDIEGESAQFTYTAKLFDPDGNELTGADYEPMWSYKSSVSDSKVKFNTDTGVLTVAKDASDRVVTLTATYGDISESFSVRIGKRYPTTVTIDGTDTINSYMMTEEVSYTYTVDVLDQNGSKMDNQTVEWTFSTDAQDNKAAFKDGVLTVPLGVSDQTVTITAKCGGAESAPKTVEIKKTIVDLPENYTAAASMKLRGFGNTSAMSVNPEHDEIGMKASAPGLFSFDLSHILIDEDAANVVTGLTLTIYKQGGNNIDLGMWEYADPHDTERTDGKAWIDGVDWTDTAVKADMLNNYALVFGIGDFSVKANETGADYAPGRDSYIAPIATAKPVENVYTFSITGDAVKDIIEHAKANNGIADIDQRTQSVQIYMTGVAETENEQYMPVLGVDYNLPSTPRRIDISGNDPLYINSQVQSYTSRYEAQVFDQFGNLYEDQSVEWSADLSDVKNVSFNNGVLTINRDSTEGTVTIMAKSAFAVGTKTVNIQKIPDNFKNGTFEDTDDSYLAAGWTPNVPVYKINFDDTDSYYPWHDAQINDGKTIWTRTKDYEAEAETGAVRGTSGKDSTIKLEYSTTLSDEEALDLMNSVTQSVGVNNAETGGFMTVGHEIPYYYMVDYYLSNDSEQLLANQGLYIGLEFRNRADTGYLAAVATGDKIMPMRKGAWQTYTGTFTSGTAAQIKADTQMRVNLGVRGLKGTGYFDYFRLTPKGIDTQYAYDGGNSMQVANTLTWESDMFSVEQNSYYTYYASVRPESNIVDGQITYTFMDNNYGVVGEYSVTTAEGDWSDADENGWKRIEGEIQIPAGATICKVTLSNPDGTGNVWFDGLVFTKTGEAKPDSIRITGSSGEVVIPEKGDNRYQYTATVYDQFNNVMTTDISWSAAKADGSEYPGITISGSGILTVSASAAPGDVIITASSGGISAARTAKVIAAGESSGEPESEGEYGLNGSFTENDGTYPYGWTNEGREVVHYTFDAGIESWKGNRSDYGAPLDGQLDWSAEENYTKKPNGGTSGSLDLYNPSYNQYYAQIPADVSLHGGMPYSFELRFKANNISDDSRVYANLRYFNSRGDTLGETANMLRYYENDYNRLKDENGWQKWSGTENVSANAATVRMELRYRGGLNNSDGHAYFDDVTIAKVTNLDYGNMYNGNPSLMLVGYNEDVTTAGRDYGERWVSDKIINISQGNSYEYGAMFKTYGASSGAYLSFIFYDADGNEISTVKSDRITGTTNSWTPLSGAVTAPSGAEKAAIAYTLDGKGTSWVSGITFTSMSSADIAGIKINGASSITVPTSGNKTETYTVSTVNSAGSVTGAADAALTASCPEGTDFKNGVLTVSNGASAGTVTLNASYGSFNASMNVTIRKPGTNDNNTSTGGGGGGGAGGGTTTTGSPGGGGASGGAAAGGTPMGNLDYSNPNSLPQNSNTGNTNSEIPSLLQAPPIDYFTGGLEVVFDDIDGVPWAQDAINALYRAGVVNGRGGGKFAPDDNVTRAEFVTMLVKTFRLNYNDTPGNFTDVSDSDWYSVYVNTAVEKGIVKGMTDDYFGASENITRQDIAVMGMRLWDYLQKEMTGNYNASFADSDQISDYARDAVTALTEAGIINGMDDGRFAPLENATRAQSAVIIYRLAVKYDE